MAVISVFMFACEKLAFTLWTVKTLAWCTDVCHAKNEAACFNKKGFCVSTKQILRPIYVGLQNV